MSTKQEFGLPEPISPEEAVFSTEREEFSSQKTLDAIHPTEVEGHLESTILQERLNGDHESPGYKTLEHELWEEFSKAEPDGVEELGLARQIAELNLLKTAEQQQFEGRDKELWAQRFTESGESLFGKLDVKIAGGLFNKQLSGALQFESDDLRVLVAQSRINRLFPNEVEQDDVRADEREVLDEATKEKARKGMFEVLGPIQEVIAQVRDGEFTSAATREVFERVIEKFGETAPEWREWTVTNTPGAKTLSVDAMTKTIEVPDGRLPTENKTLLFASTLHEIGVHAYRGVKGYEANDPMLANGLSGYTDFEEGLGCFFEYLVTDEIPQRSKDRYVDIALATGAINGAPINREELLQFVIDRQTIRDAQAREEIDMDKISENANVRVNRIFRGGDGMAYAAESGEIIQAILVKDKVYYEGFLTALNYVSGQLAAGRDSKELMEYLLQGKFNPTLKAHGDYVDK